MRVKNTLAVLAIVATMMFGTTKAQLVEMDSTCKLMYNDIIEEWEQSGLYVLHDLARYRWSDTFDIESGRGVGSASHCDAAMEYTRFYRKYLDDWLGLPTRCFQPGTIALSKFYHYRDGYRGMVRHMKQSGCEAPIGGWDKYPWEP